MSCRAANTSASQGVVFQYRFNHNPNSKRKLKNMVEGVHQVREELGL